MSRLSRSAKINPIRRFCGIHYVRHHFEHACVHSTITCNCISVRRRLCGRASHFGRGPFCIRQRLLVLRDSGLLIYGSVRAVGVAWNSMEEG